MATTKNLCAQISLDLHQKISEGKEAAGLTTAQYITELLTEYFKMKENGGKTEASVECVGRKIRYGQHLPERGASPS